MDKATLEQKATNKDLEAQAIVANEIKKGNYVFKAQELLKENEELFLKKNYSAIFKNIQRINTIVRREETAVMADKASYHQEWLLTLMKVLMKKREPDAAKKVNRDIESIGLAMDTKDLKAALIAVNKAVGEAQKLPKDTLLEWYRGTVVDLNLKVDELMDMAKGRQDKFKALKENPLDIIRNYLEELLTLIAYEDVQGTREPIERSYAYIWQIRRYLEQYQTRKIPDEIKEMKENLDLDLNRFIHQMSLFSNKYDVNVVMKSSKGSIKRSSEDYTEGYINRQELKDDLEKSKRKVEKKKAQVHEEIALKVISAYQKRIDKIKSWDMDASLAQTIYNQLTEAYGQKDYDNSIRLLGEVKGAIKKKKMERQKGSALSLIEPVESYIASVEEEGVEVSEARTLVAMALDHVEKSEFDMVERRVLEAKEKATELRKIYFQGETSKIMYNLNKDIFELKNEGKDVSKAELNLRQSKMMMENNNLEKAREYIELVKAEIENLQLDLKPKPAPTAIATDEPAPVEKNKAKPKPKHQLSADEVELEKVLLGQITQFSLEINTIERYYGDPAIPNKILEKARARMEYYEFEKVQSLLKKFRVRSKEALLKGMKGMMVNVKAQGVETDYLEFVLQQTTETVDKGELDGAEEYIVSLKDTLKDFALPGEDEEEEEDAGKCSKCGADVSEDDAFCSKCGTKVGA